MLRASWAFNSLSFIPGARSRLDRPIRLWRQERSFTSTLKSFSLKDPESTITAEAPVDAPEPFTPSTDISSGFRFPPFPLATVEDVDPKLSAEVETETQTDIFEPPSPEYKHVYERLSQPSADILTQVVRSLPDLLPEPEIGSTSIFEDKAHLDYAIETSFSPTHPITSTQSLEILVAERNYEQALLVLDQLLEVGTEIPCSFAYEEAAMSAIKVQARTQAEMEDQVQRFGKWLSLIPAADQSRPRRFRRLIHRILLSPVNSLRLIMEFGLIAAEKGFATATHYHATSIVARYGDPDVTIRFIDEIRRRHRTFLARTSPDMNVEILDRRLHVDIVGLAVRTLARAGRFDHALQLFPDPQETTFHLTSYTYNFLLRKLRKLQDPRYLPHIKFVTEHKSEARLRTPALKNMDKSKLALAIRCLANAGQFDLAIGLLPELEEADATIAGPTLDALITTLHASGDDRYLLYLERVSQLRHGIRLSPMEAQPAQLTLDGEKDEFGPAIECLARAWCLDEAIALVPAYLRARERHTTRIYDLLISKLKRSCDPKYHSALAIMQEMRQRLTTLQRLERVSTAKQAALAASNVKAPQLSELTGVQELPVTQEADREGATDLKDFSPEDYDLSSSFPSDAPQRVETLGAALRALKKGLSAISPLHRPHPLSIVRFLELYLGSGRTRAIPLLRNLVLRRGNHEVTQLYMLAELIFHGRNRNPDLVIQTFVTHFYIVGLPRDDILQLLESMECDPETEWIWAAEPRVKLHPNHVHTAMVWRALLELTRDDRGLTSLYDKLLRFADLGSESSSTLHPGVPYLHPPPGFKTGVDAAAFTPFVRRICRAFGPERGMLIIKDMLNLKIKPTIHQLTELAMEYSRSGDVAKTLGLLDQVEAVVHAWEDARAAEMARKAEANAAAAEGVNPNVVENEPRAIRDHLLPRVDRVFYVAVVRGFLQSNRLDAARDVERRMYKRYGYVAGENHHVDVLYADLQAAESGQSIPLRPTVTSVVHKGSYKALLEKPLGSVIIDPDLSPPHVFEGSAKA